MTEFDSIDDLIGRVLAQEATPEESLQLNQWLQQNEANRHYYEQVKTIFQKASATTVQASFDEDEAWQKVKSKLKKQGKQVSFSRPYLLRIAAGVALVMVATYFVYQWMPPGTQSFAVQSEKKITRDTLPDGSITVLNKRSEIAFEYSAKNRTRKVKLTGEAYFEVKHEEAKPFVIEAAEEVLIKDLGTAFNVKAYPNSDTVEVFVESGEVQFYTLKNPGLNLKAGEVGIYNKSLKEFTRLTRLDTNALAYKTKIFSFNNTELKVAVEMLNEVYDSKILLSNTNIGHCRLTVNFNNDKIEDIAEIIAETMNLKLERKGEEYILSGSGCEKLSP